jgi:putative phosphoribosyl transferase
MNLSYFHGKNMAKFINRNQAGQILAEELKEKGFEKKGAIIYALPRGGLPLGAEIAAALNLPLDVIMVRKIGAPLHHELALGALVIFNQELEIILNDEIVHMIQPSEDYLKHEIAAQIELIKQRQQAYGLSERDIKNKDIILVDDGIATGATVKAAISGLRKKHPKSITLAVPVMPLEHVSEFEALVDHLICPHMATDFAAVGQFYDDFGEVTDQDVISLLVG